MARVAVLGSLNMDMVMRVPALPRPGETVLGDRLLRLPGGKGANQAAAAARLGARVRLIGRVGADAFGEELATGLEADGVDVSGVARDDVEPTGAALIMVESGGQNLIAVAPGANGRVGDAEVGRLLDRLGTGDVVVLQLEVPLPTVLAAAAAARRADLVVVLNAAPSGHLATHSLPEVDLLVVNETEAADLTGVPIPGVEAAAAAAEQLGRRAPAVAVTLGAAGAILWEQGHATHIDPLPVEAVDVTAAGDAFIGAAALGMSEGWNILEAVRLGAAAGAATVSRVGARSSLPRPGDLHRLFGIDLEQRRPSRQGST